MFILGYDLSLGCDLDSFWFLLWLLKFLNIGYFGVDLVVIN